MRKKTRITGTVLLITAMLFLLGCNFNNPLFGSAAPTAPTNISAWIAYWDLAAGSEDLAQIENRLQQLAYFAAYFDKADRLFLPKELIAKRQELSKQTAKYETYLTFVNDKQNADGTVSLKDYEVLRRIFADETLMQQHIDEIIALAKQGNYHGIEIDYERIWKDASVGRGFLRFCNKLYMQAVINNLKLRIVLEPSTPFATTLFPYGPEYVVMLYNLYGLHSSPGPKANPAFIQKTIRQMGAIPGKKAVALSTGGCVWGDNGEKRFITEAEAKALAAKYDSKVKRDADSQCMVFDYTDAGVLYKVWYADATTLNHWITAAKKQGQNNINLWRLGGNISLCQIR